MRLSFILVVACAFIATACGPGDSPGTSHDNGPKEPTTPEVSPHEKHANEILDAMNELTESLRQVSDLASAKSAAAKISTMSERFDSIATKLAPLDPPEAELKTRITGKLVSGYAELQEVLGEGLEKRKTAIGPEAAGILQNSLNEFFRKVDAAVKEFERHFKADEAP